MTQPAQRMTNTPARNTAKMRSSGWPPLETHSAHNAGHISSQMPMGRCMRMSSAYCFSVSPTRGKPAVNSGSEAIDLRRRDSCSAAAFMQFRHIRHCVPPSAR